MGVLAADASMAEGRVLSAARRNVTTLVLGGRHLSSNTTNIKMDMAPAMTSMEVDTTRATIKATAHIMMTAVTEEVALRTRTINKTTMIRVLPDQEGAGDRCQAEEGAECGLPLAVLVGEVTPLAVAATLQALVAEALPRPAAVAVRARLVVVPIQIPVVSLAWLTRRLYHRLMLT